MDFVNQQFRYAANFGIIIEYNHISIHTRGIKMYVE